MAIAFWTFRLSVHVATDCATDNLIAESITISAVCTFFNTYKMQHKNGEFTPSCLREICLKIVDITATL